MTAAAKAKSGKHWRRIIALTLFAGLMLAALALANSGRAAIETPPPPSVWSDKADYAPGEQVALSGANWAPGESVHIRVNDDAGETWRRDVDVTADESGAISDQFNLPDWFVAQYSVTATGASSGTATWSFTDSSPMAATISIRKSNCTTASTSFTNGDTVCMHSTVTVSAGGNQAYRVQWFAPGAGTSTFEDIHVLGAAGTVTFDDSHAVSTNGTWTVKACGSASCNGSNFLNDPGQTFTVNANAAPVCSNGSATTNEDTPKAITLNCTDADGNPLTYSIVSGPSHGSLTGTAPNLTYNPALNYNGTDSFTFKANDGSADSNVATFNITINAVNDVPTCTNGSATTNEDTSVATPLSCADVDSGSLTYTIVSGPSNGVLSGSGASRSYAPNLNFNGTDSFTFKANDGSVDSNVATFNITINAVNDAPTCTNGSATTNEDTSVATPLSCADVDSASLTYSILSGPSNGVLSGSGASRSYAPNLNFNGTDSFTFKANDGALDSNTATVSVTVNAVNDAPVCTDGSATTDEDTPKAITLACTDVDSASLTYSIVSGPSHGSVTGGTGANRTYSPALNYNGSDSFTFQASDGSADSNVATFDLTINAVDDDPTVTRDDASVTVNEGDTATNSGTYDDVDGDTVTLSASVGTVTPNGDGTWDWSYSTSDGPDQTQTVTITASDGSPPNTTVTFALTVNNVAPSVTSAADQSSNEGENHSFALGSFTDPGPDGPWSVDVDWGDGSTHASFSKSGPGSLGTQDHIYADGPNDYTVTVEVTEAGSGTPPSGQATFAVHVNNVAPTVTFANDNDTLVNEGTTHTYSFTVTDPGDDDFSVLAFDCGTEGTVDEDSLATDASGGSFDCAFPNGPATTSVHVKVEDSDHASDTDSEAIQVVHVANVAPSVTSAADQSSNEGENHSFALGSFTDPGPDADWSVDVNWGDGSTHTTFTASDVGSLGSQSHTYTNGPSDYTVTVTVTDHEADPTDQLSGSGTFAVHVNNVAPSVTAASDQSSNEGESHSFALGSFTDPGPDGPWSVDVDWGDGSTHASFSKSGPGSLGTQDHIYADGPNDYTVTVKVTEAGSGTPPSGQATFAVHVNNVAPTGTLGNNGPISEGGPATISFSGVSDPSAADDSTLHYAFSCTGDSLAGATYASSSTSSSTSCSFSDGPSTPTVTGVIIDKDGGRHADMTTVTVNNVKPIVTAPADQNATEGSSATFSLGSFSDPGADNPWTGSVTWGDGSSNSAIGPFSSVGSLGSASHTFANSGSYTVKVSVTDKDGGTGYTTFKVTVSNVAPTVTAAANQSGDEGTEKNFDLGSFSDPGAESSWSVDVNWGDGSTHTTFTKSSTGSLGSRPHTYADNGSYTVTVNVSDDADQGSASFTVAVGNVAPVPTWTSYSNILYGPMVFGLTGTWSGSFTDPGDDAPWTATFAWNGVNDPGQTKTFTSSDPKTFSVRPNFGTAGCQLTGKVTVTEQEGPSGTDTKTVNVGSGEFLPPMTNQPVTDKLKNGQVLPVKVRIADCNGNPISGLSPKIELKLGDLTSEVADNSVQPIDITNASSADTSGFMRAVDGSYMYNLRINVPTNTLNQAYTIVITPNAAGYPSGMTLRHKIVATK